MTSQIEICRQDEIATAVASLEGRGPELLRRAQDIVYAHETGALACAGAHCWMELHDVIGKGATLEAAIRDWRDNARGLLPEAA